MWGGERTLNIKRHIIPLSQNNIAGGSINCRIIVGFKFKESRAKNLLVFKITNLSCWG